MQPLTHCSVSMPDIARSFDCQFCCYAHIWFDCFLADRSFGQKFYVTYTPTKTRRLSSSFLHVQSIDRTVARVAGVPSANERARDESERTVKPQKHVKRSNQSSMKAASCHPSARRALMMPLSGAISRFQLFAHVVAGREKHWHDFTLI